MARNRKGQRRKKQSRWRGRLVLVVLAVAVVAVAWLCWPFWQSSDQFAERPVKQPSRLYGEPVMLEVNRSSSAQRLVKDLESMGYRRVGNQQGNEGQQAVSRISDKHA